MELVLTGKIIDAKEALDYGLVSKVVELNILNKEVEDLAESIASKSLPVLMLAKEAVVRSYETTLSEGMINERRLFQSTFALRDRKEGMEAFLNKRKPKFNNK
jgi:enoyl-CoA hydratase